MAFIVKGANMEVISLYVLQHQAEFYLYDYYLLSS